MSSIDYTKETHKHLLELQKNYRAMIASHTEKCQWARSYEVIYHFRVDARQVESDALYKAERYLVEWFSSNSIAVDNALKKFKPPNSAK